MYINVVPAHLEVKSGQLLEKKRRGGRIEVVGFGGDGETVIVSGFHSIVCIFLCYRFKHRSEKN